MAASDVSSRLSSFEIDGHDIPDSINVDEIVEATIEEATREAESGYEQPGGRYQQNLQDLPRDLYEYLSVRSIKTALSFRSIRRACRRLRLSLKCVFCHQEGNAETLCICSGCQARTYHRSCWPLHGFHQPSENGAIVCRPPIDFVEYVWIKYLLQPHMGREEQAILHKADMWSAWFNVPNQQDSPNMYLYPRLQWLINHAQALRDDSKTVEQFPSLVSFFGDTG